MADNNTNEVTAEQYAQAVFEDGGNLIVDLSGIEEMKFEVLPKGIYQAKIDDVQYGASKTSGNKMFTFVFAIDGGDYSGRKLYTYGSFSPKALKGTKTLLNRIDAELFAGQFNPQEIVDSGKLLGRVVTLKVSIEERKDTGEDQNRVQVMPANAGAPAAGGGDGFFK